MYRNRHGGGIKIFLRHVVQAKLLDEYTFIGNLFEAITIELVFGQNKVFLCCVYHPPTPSVAENNDFIDSFIHHIKLLSNVGVPLVTAGDFNLNLFNPNKYVYVDHFVNSMFEVGMAPIITIPTKVNPDNHLTRFSLIDHIWVSPHVTNSQSFVHVTDITDHFFVGAVLKFPYDINLSPQKERTRPLTPTGMVSFSIYLSNISLSLSENINLTFDRYISDVFKYYNASFPIKETSNRVKQFSPWMTPRLLQCIKKKSKLYKLYLRGKITKDCYIYYRNRLTALLRKVKKFYYSKLLLTSTNDPRKMWSYLNEIMDKKTGHCLKELEVEDLTLVGRDLANHINRYFVTAVSVITANLNPDPTYEFYDAPLGESCYLFPTNNFEVRNVIKKLKNKGNKLLDVHPSIIKGNIEVFSSHIEYLYNLSLLEAEYPNRAKIGRVHPIYKSGPKNSLNNYRPISVLGVFSKIFEMLTLNRINSFISRHNILSPRQFGFRKGCSTTNAVMEFLSPVIKAYHDKAYCACFFLDLRKAFDTVDHQVLLKKFHHYGFRGHCLKYLASYFKNRQQKVHIDGFESELMDITSGVPQGSIIGPTCFNIFINDIALAVDADVFIFADDAAFVIRASSLSDLFNKIEKLFRDLTLYLNKNKLVANATKCKLMMFNSRPFRDLPDISFGNEVIEWVQEFKYLGLTITYNLNFAKHINKVSLSICRVTGIINNLRSFLPEQVLIKMYYALAYPHLINHVVVWGSAPQSHLKILKSKVNNLLRLIFGIGWTDYRPNISTNEMYRSNNILKIESIFKLYIFKLLKLLLDGKLPELYRLFLEPNSATRNNITRNRLFRHPLLSNEVERRFLPHQLITLHESTPDRILAQPIFASIRDFKNHLLTIQ